MISGYKISENWFSFVAENNDKVDCKHTALYLYLIEVFNKRQWVETIGLPTDFTMCFMKMSYKTYKKTLDDLVDWGFVIMVKKAQNQFTSNVIALGKITKADTKASLNHLPKQDQIKSDILKQYNNITLKQINNILAHANSLSKSELILFLDSFLIEQKKEEINQRQIKFKESLRIHLSQFGKDILNEFFLYWTEHGENDKKMRFEKQTSFDIKRRLDTWKKNNEKFNQNGKQQNTTAKPKFRSTFASLANKHEQTEVSNTEGELFEDTEYTELE